MGLLDLSKAPIGVDKQLQTAFGYTPPAVIPTEPIDPRTGVQAPLRPGGSTTAIAPVPQLTAAQIATARQAELDANAARAIQAGYGLVEGVYDRQLAEIPNQIRDANAIVDSQYGAQKGSIDSAYARGNANLQYSRDYLSTQTKRGIQDLAKSIRQSFDSYSTLIGGLGAGDSSATGQLSYALHKAEAENRADIYRSQNDQLGAIALKQGDLDAQNSDQLNQLNAWKSQQVISIGQQFRQAMQAIEAAKANATKEKLIALAARSTDTVNEAIAALSGVEARHSAAVAAIRQTLQSAQAPGNPQALAATNYEAQALPAAQPPAINLPQAQPAEPVAAVPYYRRLQAA